MPPIQRKQDTQPANPFTDLICSINGLIASNQAIIAVTKEQTTLMKEQLDTLTQVVITGDPKNGTPSLVEISRNHQKDIDDWKEVRTRVTWIVAGAVITAIIAGGWYVALHVFGGG